MYIGSSNQKEEFDNGHNGSGPALSIFGDSLSTGVLASTTLGLVISGVTLDRFNRMFLGSKFSMKDYQSQFSEYRYSAMTTDLNWGLRHQIAEQHGLSTADIPVFLFSKWGGRTDHLEEFQVEIQDIYKSRKVSEYVLVQIGGNDYCKEKTAEKFRTDYKKFLNEVFKKHPESNIFIADIPPLPQLLNYSHKYSQTLSCTKFRQKFCKRLFYKDAEKVFAEFNQVIKEESNEAMEQYSNVKFSNLPGKMNLKSEDVAFDCFHPSHRGHEKLGEIYAKWFTLK